MVLNRSRFCRALICLALTASGAGAHGGHDHGVAFPSRSASSVSTPDDSAGEGFWPFSRKPSESVGDVEELEEALGEERQKAIDGGAPEARLARLDQRRAVLAVRKEIAARRAERDVARGSGDAEDAERLEREVHALKKKLKEAERKESSLAR